MRFQNWFLFLFYFLIFFLNFKLLSDDEIRYLFTCDALSIQYLLLYRCWINTMKAVKKYKKINNNNNNHKEIINKKNNTAAKSPCKKLRNPPIASTPK